MTHYKNTVLSLIIEFNLPFLYLHRYVDNASFFQMKKTNVSLIENFEELIPIIDKYDNEKTLFIFDLDNTLFMASDVHYGSHQWFEVITKAIGLEDAGVTWMLTQNDITTLPCEESIPRVLERITKSSKIICTARPKNMLNMGNVTIKQLSESKLLKYFVSSDKDIELSEKAVYSKGNIFCHFENKSKLVKKYIQKAGKSFKNIIFVDDLESTVQKFVKDFTDINIIGICYTQTRNRKFDKFKLPLKYINDKQKGLLEDFIKKCGLKIK